MGLNVHDNLVKHDQYGWDGKLIPPSHAVNDLMRQIALMSYLEINKDVDVGCLTTEHFISNQCKGEKTKYCLLLALSVDAYKRHHVGRP